jgi:hypothetical protein
VLIGVDVTGDVDGRVGQALKAYFNGLGFKTGDADVKNAAYTAAAKLSMQKADFGAKDGNFYIQYNFQLSVSTVKAPKEAGGVALFSFEKDGREGHVTEQQARERVLRRVQDMVASGACADSFGRFLAGLASK